MSPNNSAIEICPRNERNPSASASSIGTLLQRSEYRTFLIFTLGLTALFGKPFFDLIILAFKDSFYSHVLLVPVVSIYLGWQCCSGLPLRSNGSPAWITLFSSLGVSFLAVSLYLYFSGAEVAPNTFLFWVISAYVLFILAGCEFILGHSLVKSRAFPLAFLVFMIPFPEAFRTILEIGYQHASADNYAWLLDLSHATYFRQDLVFALPNLTIRVAQECSGIRSSLVLFITSLIAGFLFLKSMPHRWLFSLLVIPLGIFRNAFRIYFLSMASVYWDPNIINSPLHHHGGPIFFALSLIPLFLLLVFLRGRESRALLIRHVSSPETGN